MRDSIEANERLLVIFEFLSFLGFLHRRKRARQEFPKALYLCFPFFVLMISADDTDSVWRLTAISDAIDCPYSMLP